MIKISPLKLSEIRRAAFIIGKNYSKQYERLATKELREMFGKAAIKPMYFVAKDKDTIVGLAGFIQSWMDYNIYEIFWVNVSPEKQRQGVGRQLVSKIIKEIKAKKNARLILLTANQAVGNATYYKKLYGFKTLEKFGNNYHLMSLNW